MADRRLSTTRNGYPARSPKVQIPSQFGQASMSERYGSPHAQHRAGAELQGRALHGSAPALAGRHPDGVAEERDAALRLRRTGAQMRRQW